MNTMRTATGKLIERIGNIAAGNGPAGEKPVYGVVFRGRRYDTGDKADWIRPMCNSGLTIRKSAMSSGSGSSTMRPSFAQRMTVDRI